MKKVKLKTLSLSTFFMLLIACSSRMPSWIEDTKHVISPDGKALIYESILDENRISVGTWFFSNLGSGGAGVFDIQTTDSSGVKMSWISESSALIEYPANSKILRQEDSTFFAGRTIKLNYKIKD